jgi:hypothetical protein
MSDVVKLKVVLSPGEVEGFTDDLVGVMEKRGYEVIEVSRPLPCKDMDAGKVRVFFTGVKKELNHENVG